MRRLLACAGILGGAIPVFAQTSPQPQYAETVVVTAALEESTPSELSAAVTVLDEREIAARQSTEILSLLGTVPGLASTQLGSPGKSASIFVRGANSNHTLVLWNGVPLNDPYFGGFDWANLPSDGVERVEVVRGPFSALWGNDALGGVINVLTRRSPGVSLRVEGGDDDYRRAAGVAGHSGERFGVVASGHSRRGDGEVDNDFFDSDGLAVRANWARAEAAELGLVVRLDRSRIGVPFDFFGAPSPERRQTSRDREVALPASFAWGRGDFETLLSLGRTDLEFSDPHDPFAASDTEAERRRARAVLGFEVGEQWRIAGGGDWQRSEATSRDAFGLQLDERSQRTWSSFVQADWRRGNWRLDAGLRRDDNDAFGAETTTKLGVVWRLRDGLRLRSSYGEGFHAPTLADLYYPGFSNPALEPERSSSFELGLDGRHGAFSWALAGFASEFDELIQFDFSILRPFNTGRARSRGLEAEARWSRGTLGLGWNATLLDAEDRDTGKTLLRRPRQASNLLVTWRPRSLTVHAEARYVGERFDVGDVRLPAHVTAALALAYRLPRRDWLEPYARVENLFDRRYEDAKGFPAPDRRVIVGVALRP